MPPKALISLVEDRFVDCDRPVYGNAAGRGALDGGGVEDVLAMLRASGTTSGGC